MLLCELDFNSQTQIVSDDVKSDMFVKFMKCLFLPISGGCRPEKWINDHSSDCQRWSVPRLRFVGDSSRPQTVARVRKKELRNELNIFIYFNSSAGHELNDQT